MAKVFLHDFQTRDLGRAEEFLNRKGLSPPKRWTRHTIALGTNQAFGMTVGFTDQLTPGDFAPHTRRTKLMLPIHLMTYVKNADRGFKRSIVWVSWILPGSRVQSALLTPPRLSPGAYAPA